MCHLEGDHKRRTEILCIQDHYYMAFTCRTVKHTKGNVNTSNIHEKRCDIHIAKNKLLKNDFVRRETLAFVPFILISLFQPIYMICVKN